VRESKPLAVVLFLYLPVILIAWLAYLSAKAVRVGFDFAIFRIAGHAVLHGQTPYVAPKAALLAQNTHYVYPQPFAYLFVPFAAIGEPAGAVIFLLISAAAVAVALRLLGATDRRLWGLAVLSPPLFVALGFGAIGPLLLLGVAAGWRLRHSAWAGVALALVAAAKLFLWPVLVWLLVTRRFRALLAAAATTGLLVGVWALTDPHGLAQYPRLLKELDAAHRSSSYSPEALWYQLSLPGVRLVPLFVALAGIAVIARCRDDRPRLAAAIFVALLSSPIVWLHYYVLLAAPLALYRPRLSAAWLVPLCLWVTPFTDPHGSVWKICVAIAVVAGVWLAITAPVHGRFSVMRLQARPDPAS
jgi:hypothetical protein